MIYTQGLPEVGSWGTPRIDWSWLRTAVTCFYVTFHHLFSTMSASNFIRHTTHRCMQPFAHLGTDECQFTPPTKRPDLPTALL